MSNIDTKLVVISEFFDPSENSTGYLVDQLCRELMSDFIICKIAPSTHLSQWKPTKRYTKVAKKIFVLVNLIYQTQKLSGPKSTLLIASNPFLNWFMTRAFGKFKKKHLLVFDVFPETGATIFKKWQLEILTSMRNWSLSKNVSFICIGRDMAEYLSRTFQKNNCIDVGLWVEGTSVNCNTHIHDNPRLLFFGNFGELTDFDAVKKISKQDHRDYEISIVGTGSERFQGFFQKSDNDKILESVYFENRSSVYQHKTACLVIQHPKIMGMAVPSKAFFSWENNLPIIYFGDPKSEIFRLLNENTFLGHAFDYSELNDANLNIKINSIMKGFHKQGSDPRIQQWLQSNRVISMERIKHSLAPGK